MRCKFWDSGYCYAPKGITTNADNGACNNPNGCPYLLGNDNERLSKLCIEQQHQINSMRSQLKRIREIAKE